MKVITDKDWILEASTEQGFLFKSKRFGDYLIVQSAKYVLRKQNIVFFCGVPHGFGSVEKNHITLSKSSRRRLESQTNFSRDLRDLLNLENLQVEQVHKLSAL